MRRRPRSVAVRRIVGSVVTVPALALVLFVVPAAPANATVTVHGLFSDHMVLQRDVPVTLRGKAAPGEQIRVSLSTQAEPPQKAAWSTVADKAGDWSVALAAMKSSTNTFALTIAGENTLAIKNVVVGDVWICSGQSNMEFLLGHCGRPDDAKDSHLPLIREFRVPHVLTGRLQSDVRGKWTVCTPESAGGFSAVAFYFGRKVHRETGVPIGLITAVSSGTPIEPFVPAKGLTLIPELADDKIRVDKQIAEYRRDVSAALGRLESFVAETRKALDDGADLPELPQLPVHPALMNRPCGWHCVYNGMIHPVTGFPIKGALWYQGETNASEGDAYFHKMRALVGGWRNAWSQGDFPFYFVQLPSYGNPTDRAEGGDAWAKIRMAQFKALAIPRTGMAVAIDLADVGNPGDIHPKNKRDVGERLALWALAKDYGRTDLVYSGPVFKDMRVEGDTIRVFFDGVGSGLTVATKKGYAAAVEEPSGRLQRFAVAGQDRRWVWAQAVIDGKTVVVSSPEVRQPVAVRYAYSINPEGCNLYNKDGLPASPFRTDEW